MPRLVPAAFNRRIRLLIAAAVILVVGYAAVHTAITFRLVRTQAEGQVLALARLVEQHATATIGRTDLALLAVTDKLNGADFAAARTLPAQRRAAIEQILRAQQRRTPGVVSMSLTDADGYVFANSVGAPPGVSLASRSYFQELKARPHDRPVVSEAILGRVSNKWGIQIARRIDRPDGAFAGMLVANLGLHENFETFYDSLALGRDAIVSLRSSDNHVLVRHPPRDNLIGTRIHGSAGTAAVSAGGSEAVVVSRSPIDGIERLAAMRRVPDYPIYAIVGLGKDEVFANWRRDSAWNGVLLVLFVAVTISLARLLARHQRELDGANQSLGQALAELQEKERAKSNFFAAASHDLRQPIHAAGLFLDALQRMTNDAAQLKLIASIATATRTLNELLDSLLNISKLDAGAVKPHFEKTRVLGLFERLDNNFAPVAQEHGLRLKFWFPRRAVTLRTDARLLSIILSNIVDNAFKNTLSGGVLVALRRHREYWAFEIWDTGSGIGGGHAARVYEEFFQIGNPHRDRRKGMGLGLSIARRVADLLGYRLGFRSRVGRGTVFEIRLPPDAVGEEELAEGCVATADGAPDLGYFRGKRFAIVEDDELVADALSNWLRAIGAEVQAWGSAEAALAAPAIVADYYIVDYQLPGRLTGIDVLETLTQRRGRAPHAVVVSGHTSGAFIDAAGKSPWPLVFKPAKPLQILAALEPGVVAAP